MAQSMRSERTTDAERRKIRLWYAYGMSVNEIQQHYPQCPLSDLKSIAVARQENLRKGLPPLVVTDTRRGVKKWKEQKHCKDCNTSLCEANSVLHRRTTGPRAHHGDQFLARCRDCEYARRRAIRAAESKPRIARDLNMARQCKDCDVVLTPENNRQTTSFRKDGGPCYFVRCIPCHRTFTNARYMKNSLAKGTALSQRPPRACGLCHVLITSENDGGRKHGRRCHNCIKKIARESFPKVAFRASSARYKTWLWAILGRPGYIDKPGAIVGKGLCQHCHTKPLPADLRIAGHTKSGEVVYLPLCRPCHNRHNTDTLSDEARQNRYALAKAWQLKHPERVKELFNKRRNDPTYRKRLNTKQALRTHVERLFISDIVIRRDAKDIGKDLTPELITIKRLHTQLKRKLAK
jgi:RNase P subunit RPR2